MILCIGTTPTIARSMIFDTILRNEANRARETYDYASGKSVNCARVIHTLGKPVTAAGFIGGDRGRAHLADLDRAGISHSFTQVDPQTRLCVTVIDRANSTATEFIEESQPPGQSAWQRLSESLNALRQKAKVVVCSGSLPSDGPPDFYADQVRLKLPNQKIILDGRGAEIRQALQHDGFILKLNSSELASTLNLAPITNAREFEQAALKATPRSGALIVTMGPHGVIAHRNAAFYTVQIPKVRPISAIGSGDAFAAGLAAALYDNLPFPDSLKLAAACSIANTLTPHAGHIHRNDVQSLLPQITISDHLHWPVQ